MKPFLALVLPLVLLLCGPVSTPDAQETLPKSQPVNAILDIKRLRGTVLLNQSGEVFEVRLNNTKITDAGMKHLKSLTTLKSLVLNDTQITDAGLEHLKDLTNLNRLNLDYTQVTDAGLEHLKGLSSLNSLYIRDTQITDAELMHLKGLASLERLELDGTKITDAGMSELKAALPNCKISK
ncbi:MAG: hypothetical protein ACKVH8_24265 [Pirellulales bacterium]